VEPAPDTAVSRYYDAGSDYHLRRGGDRAHAAVLESYLTWGIFPRPEPGFSWLRTVLRPGERPNDQRRLAAGQERLRRLLFRGVDFGRVRRVLDFGCGYGSDLLALAERHPGLQLEGVTISGRQAQVGNRRAAERGLAGRVRVHHGDSARHPLRGRFDLALGLEVAGLVEDKDALFAHLAAHLEDGAIVLLADFVATGAAVDVPEVSAFTPTAREWAEVLARHGLRVLECVDVSPEVAHCLRDPAYQEVLDAALADGGLPGELRPHLASYPNTFRVLDRGLMRYVAVRALRDPRSSPREVAAFNRARMEQPLAWAHVAAEVELAALDGWCHALEWHPALPPSPSTDEARTWLVLADDGGVGHALAARVRAAGGVCVVAVPGASTAPGTGSADAERDAFHGAGEDEWTVDPADDGGFARLLAEGFGGAAPDLAVHLWAPRARDDLGDSIDSADSAGSVDSVDSIDSDDSEDGAAALGCGSALNLLRAISGLPRPPRLVLATRGARAAAAGDAPGPVQATLPALGRTVAHEHPELRCLCVDLPTDGDAEDLAAALEAEARAAGPEPEVALRGGARLAPRLVRVPAAAAEAPVRGDGAYLVTGGLGGLGMEVARALAVRGAGALVLAGRSAPGEAARAEIARIEAAGTRVVVACADVGSAAGVAAIAGQIDALGLPLRGIVHAAGVVDDATLLRTGPARLRAVWAPKVRGARNLHRLAAGRELDFFVLFSGIAALLGSPGQGAYAAANAYLDALAERRVAAGLPAVSLAWGPWAHAGRVAASAERFAADGVEPVQPELGIDAFFRLAAGPAPHVAVFSVHAERWAAAHPALAASPLLSLWQEDSGDSGDSTDATPSIEPSVLPSMHETTEPTRTDASASEAVGAGAGLRAAMLAVPAGWRRRRVMEEHLCGEIGRVLRLPRDRVEPQASMRDLGFDSLMALELRNRLDRALGLALPVTLVWSHPTVADLAASLAERMGIALDAPPSQPTASPPSASSSPSPPSSADDGGAGAWAVDDLLARMEALGDDEVERLLAGSGGEAGDD
jgi:myxalamid-type polyketide synthase MxaE and MxaD